MMKRILIALAVVGGIVGLLLAGCAYLGNQIMVEKPLPRKQKLADITNDLVVADVVWPNAEPWSNGSWGHPLEAGVTSTH